MFNNEMFGKLQVEQWIPPYIIEKIKNGPDGWLHLVTQITVLKEQEGCIIIGSCATNPTEFFVNGELIKENIEEFKEVESRLQTGL
jgi:hypothetical protein